MKIEMEAIGFVSNKRLVADDDYWGNVLSTIQLTDTFNKEALIGLEGYSHVEILFHFHRVLESEIVVTAAIPREQADKFPLLGVFAQRKKSRPNRIGATICEIVSINDTAIIVNDNKVVDHWEVVARKRKITI